MWGCRGVGMEKFVVAFLFRVSKAAVARAGHLDPPSRNSIKSFPLLRKTYSKTYFFCVVYIEMRQELNSDQMG